MLRHKSVQLLRPRLPIPYLGVLVRDLSLYLVRSLAHGRPAGEIPELAPRMDIIETLELGIDQLDVNQ